MAEITIGDVTGTAQVQVDDSSLAGKSQLSSLIFKHNPVRQTASSRE